jgi:hypothetical protein
MVYSNRVAILLAGTLLAATACGGKGTVPSGVPGAVNPASQFPSIASGVNSGFESLADTDTTSILKKIKKDIVIGATVDPTNADRGGHGLSVVKTSYGHLAKGMLVICNFDDKAGKPGAATTIDVLEPKHGAKAKTFARSGAIQGCAGNTITSTNGVVGAGFSSHLLARFSDKGKLAKTYGTPYKAPFSTVDASNAQLYNAEYIFGGDAATGGIVSFSINRYGNQKRIQVGSGFAVNHKDGWAALGPSGLQYRANKPNADTLYIADGVDNTVVAFTSASSLLVPNEIVVKPGGKTFKCKYPRTTCGRLVHSGGPLNAPLAMALLPNGNLIVANAGDNTLVELTPSGKVLATKVVDKSKKPGVFGLVAIGTNDSNTAIFFSDRNTNNVHELLQ